MKRKSSHWTDSTLPVIEATRKACGTSYDSQGLIINYVFKLFKPDSVVDIGCGKGGWIKACMQSGCTDVRGYDIPEIDVSDRAFPADKFTAADLSKRIDFGRKYDLAISTEVAEHIPSSKTVNFMNNLCSASNFLLFSAAIPYQGGMGHVNENWVEYWHRYMIENDFCCFDIIRPVFWNEPRIHWYYRQNSFIYARSDAKEMLEQKGLSVTKEPLSLIHPDMYLKAIHRGSVKKSNDLYQDINNYYKYAYDNIN